MIELDGNFGEGGGQILRSSLALSLLTGKPFHLKNVRARRSRPGLQPQHLMSVKAAAQVGQATMQVRDADELAALVGAAMLAINAPSALLWTTVVGAAPGDEELTGYHAEMLGLIRAQIEHILRYVDQRGWLRQDVPFDDLVETVCIITCVETYTRFVLQDRKSEEEYQAFVTRMMRETVLAS